MALYGDYRMFIKKDSNHFKLYYEVLKSLNSHFANHQCRVGYILLKMLEEQNILGNSEDMRDCIFMGLNHDIGVFRNVEDVKDSSALNFFEMDEHYAIRHSIFGYLFMKRFCYVTDNDRPYPILFHHVDHDNKNFYKTIGVELTDEQQLMTELIHFADALDVFAVSNKGDKKSVYLGLEDGKGSKFEKEIVDLFYKADAKYNIIDNLFMNNCYTDIEKYMNNEGFNERLLLKLSKMLIYITDFYSTSTVIHNIMTAKISEQLAEHFGVNKHDRTLLYLSASFHDIGKIKIPSSIINKHGKLTHDEFETIKLHSVYTRELLSIVFKDEAVQLSSSHHEKLDGSGYPNGLKGDEISLLCRILTVADILDALIERRSYKNEFDKNMTLQILNDMKDKGQLDPNIVDYTIANFDTLVTNAKAQAKEEIAGYGDLQQEYNSIYENFSDVINNFDFSTFL